MGKRSTVVLAVLLAMVALLATTGGVDPEVTIATPRARALVEAGAPADGAAYAQLESQLTAEKTRLDAEYQRGIDEWNAGVARHDAEVREAAQRAAAAAAVVEAPPRQPAAVATQWPTSLLPCGGDLPPCYVKQRESGGSYSARNPTSSASGAWQFLDSTWAGFGGYPSAYLAPPDVQDARARELWNHGAGCGHWSAC